MEIQDRIALVTGGASGLGEATCRNLAAAGAKVVIVDLNAEKGQALAAELGPQGRYISADVSDDTAMAAAVDVARQEFGGLQIAVCCAGIGTPRRVLGRDGVMPLADFSKIIQVNLIGTFNAMRLAAELISESEPDSEGERGVMVGTASVAAYEGQIGQAAYSASKGGIVGMTLPIARELAGRGIRVMTIAPGLFDTPLLAGLPDEAKASLGQQVPFPPRLGQPAEFASLVEHIVRSPMLNGTTIRLDGAIRMAPR